MPRQSFIWTALPNGYTADGTALRLSILLSPRLDPQDAMGNPQKLSTFFPDWQDWPKTLANARFDITYNGQTVKVFANATTGANRVDNRLGLAESTVWKALFHGDLMVQGFAYKDHSNARVLSYDTRTMTGVVAQLYRNLAKNATDRMPLVSEVFATDGWRGFVAAVEKLDRSGVSSDTGLRDPRVQFDRLGRPFGRAVDTTDLLERFQLFHTPPATPITRQETRKDDNRIDARWLEYKRSPLPKKEDIAKQLDFHQIVAAMGSYPTLLRKLGLVIDLILAPGGFTPAPSSDLSVKVVFPSGVLDIPRTADAGPGTRTRLSANRFEAISDPTAVFRVLDRLLDLGPTGFDLMQFDVDGAGLKVMNFARSLGRRFRGDAHVDPVTRHEDEMGAPALRTSGLMLVQTGRGPALSTRFALNKGRNANIEGQFTGGANTVSLHAEDLVRGYRIDIWDSATGEWHSLCRRTARYELDDGAVVVAPAPEEEATVQLATTKSSDQTSNPNVLYLHEALVSWTGWSLAAAPPGRAIRADDEKQTQMASEAEVPPGLKFKSRFAAVKGSLPRLRFGRSYWIRARAVDLAGNSLDPQPGDFGNELPFVNARRYFRYEPVAAPVIALLSNGGTIAKPAEGESMARIAIRSFNDTPAHNVVPTPQIAHRAAAPPQVSVRDAEQHGTLDADGKVDASLFNLLANVKDVDPESPSAAIRHVTIPMQGPLDPEAVDTSFAVYEAGRSLTYLPDPLALEVSARVFDHPNIANTEVITIPLYPEGAWPEARPFTIEVYDDPLEAPHFETATRRLRVPLPKGVRATIRLSMALAPDDVERMGIFELLAPADKEAQRPRAETGQHWMLTPFTVVEVVHAVQRPLLTPEFTVLLIHERDEGETSARPLIYATCSIDTTDRLDLLGEWHEPVDDADAPESKTGPADRQRRDVAFPVKITGPKQYADATKGLTAGGFPDHAVSGTDLIGINTEGDERLPVKAHEFHDTRYRRIEYWFDATTKFREFMPGQLLTKIENGKRIPVETNIKVTGARKAAWIPNSSPPPAPKVLYVIPTFGWTREIDEHGSLLSWRRGGGLRVYFDRPWQSSGYGEMLGVLLPPTGFAGDPDDIPGGAPYKKYVTQWGNDPIWDSSFVSGIAPKRDDFPLARNAPDPTGAWLPPDAPDAEKDQRPGPFLVQGLYPPGFGRATGPVDVAPHDVFYDADRQLWYCDIEIKTGASYFPFIRLALARYQPISCTGSHLSNVVLADVIALTADRWLNVTPAADARRVRVAVFGVTYDKSSAYHEASQALALSLINVLTGQVELLRPASVAKQSVVEVWVERLDPQWGEDFGWTKISDAVISQRIPVQAVLSPTFSAGIASIFGRPVSAAEPVVTTNLVSIQDVARLTPNRVIDLIQAWQTLWEGDITLPEPQGGATRHRLVIAEYEEYLVDDDRPYDNIPTRARRRLVFVEHVEFG
jgi:hypothetical protein